MKIARIAVAISALALAGSAFAADKPMDGKDSDGKLSKKEASNATRSDESGFAKMDKNKDGYISKTEAVGSAAFTKDFAKFDLNNDGKLNRAEYLAAAAKADISSAANKVQDKVSGDDKSSSTGASGKPAK